jgi:hypothetical protein
LMRIQYVAALCVLCVSRVAVAASVDQTRPIAVEVGDGTLDGSFLVPYNNAWFYSVKFADGRVVPEGIWSDHLQWTTINGKQEMLRVQGTSFISGVSDVILNVFNPKTLAPIKSEAHHIDGTIFRRTFDGRRVASVTLANAKDSKIPDAAELPQPVYDFNGGMYGILLASLPLKEGLKGTLPAIGDQDAKVSREPFEVLRQETVSAGARGSVKAWVVDSARPGNYTMRFWLTKNPPYIIRLVMTDDAHGRVMTWEML